VGDHWQAAASNDTLGIANWCTHLPDVSILLYCKHENLKHFHVNASTKLQMEWNEIISVSTNDQNRSMGLEKTSHGNVVEKKATLMHKNKYK